MKGHHVDKAVLIRVLGYVTRHLTKDKLFAPMSPNGEPVLSVGSPYHEDLIDGQYLKDWLENELTPKGGGERRSDEQMVFEFYDRRS